MKYRIDVVHQQLFLTKVAVQILIPLLSKGQETLAV